jgi:uroporphyrinogen decarboxylase
MTRRERLLTAMRRGTPDRIPFTYDATAECSERLRVHLGLSSAEEIPAHFGCDQFGSLATLVGRSPIAWNQPDRRADGTRLTLWGTPLKKVEYPGGFYWEYDTPPLAAAETVADVERHAWPDPSRVEFAPLPPPGAWKPRQAETVFGDSSFIGPFGIAWQVRGMESIMLDMIENPALVESIVAHIEAFTLPLLKRFLETYKGAIDFVCCGDDFGTQLGLMIGREPFRRFFAPSLKRHFELARAHGVIAYQHCCGAIYDIIPDLIDCGVQVLNPIQTRAAGMDPARLKREFGSALAFHGGIDVQKTLPGGTPEEVRREVRERVAQLGPNGYVLCSSHAMQADIPPGNIVAMYDEIGKRGLTHG